MNSKMNYKQTYAPKRDTMTRPNQALSVDDILSRFTRGQSLPLARVSHDDPQNLSEEEQMALYECDDEFDRLDVLQAVEEGKFNSGGSSASKAKRSEAKSAERTTEENSSSKSAESSEDTE